jgi:hypothetical protein
MAMYWIVPLNGSRKGLGEMRGAICNPASLPWAPHTPQMEVADHGRYSEFPVHKTKPYLVSSGSIARQECSDRLVRVIGAMQCRDEIAEIKPRYVLVTHKPYLILQCTVRRIWV